MQGTGLAASCSYICSSSVFQSCREKPGPPGTLWCTGLVRAGRLLAASLVAQGMLCWLMGCVWQQFIALWRLSCAQLVLVLL